MTDKLSKSALAKLLRVSTRTITTWQQADDFPQPTQDGRSNLYDGPAVLQWRRAKDAASLMQSKDGDTINEARRRKMTAEASIAELELSKMRGELIDLETVGHEWLKIVTAARSQMLAIPAKLAPLLAIQTDPGKVCKLLTRELEEALAELSRFECSEET